MKLIEKKAQGQMMLPYHGIASYNYRTNMTTTAIVPLNWFIAIGLSVWSFLRFGNKEIVFSSRNAYRQGYRHGLEVGTRNES